MDILDQPVYLVIAATATIGVLLIGIFLVVRLRANAGSRPRQRPQQKKKPATPVSAPKKGRNSLATPAKDRRWQGDPNGVNINLGIVSFRGSPVALVFWVLLYVVVGV